MFSASNPLFGVVCCMLSPIWIAMLSLAVGYFLSWRRSKDQTSN
jgi:hypothetical protein